MIALSNVSAYTRKGRERTAILDDVSVVFGARQRVGILAPASSGKTTIARLLSRIDKPRSGNVLVEGRVSWPLGLAGFLHPELTGAMNVAIVAETLGEDPADVLAFCTRLTGQADGFKQITKNYSPTVRAGLAFALSLARPCDHFIADDKIAIGDGDARERFSAMLDQRLETAGLVFLSRNARSLEKACSRFFVLHRAKLIEVDAAQTAADVLEEAARQNA